MLSIQPIILCGGTGSRLWPLSRAQYPKQLLSLMGSDSLLQATLKRLDSMNDFQLLPPIVVANEDYRFQVAEQMRTSNRSGQIILEPVGKSTAPALTLAALACLSQTDDAILVVMPSDHLVQDTGAFHAALTLACQRAQVGSMVTFGISPTGPITGYGYIQVREASANDPHGIWSIDRFIEKPPLAVAEQLLKSGAAYWNSGLFVVRASVWLNAVKHCLPDVEAPCRLAWNHRSEDGDFVRVPTSTFEMSTAISIDVGIMEKCHHHTDTNSGLPPTEMVPLNAGWSDIGTWEALWAVSKQDEQGNAQQGDVVMHGCNGNLILSNSRLVACVGISDLVVVETPDAVLVMPKSQSQGIKLLLEKLNQEERPETLTPRKVYRPWGWYDSIDNGERFQVKRIVVKPGGKLSLQKHHHRAEHWIVVRGTALVTKEDNTELLSENQSTYIPLGVTHRLENPGRMALEMIEVQSGSYLGEDDIVRLEDVYGRNAATTN
jgi:mannose-1-phosphate guanylyltransferase/mannose-6-phosphate isomerase